MNLEQRNRLSSETQKNTAYGPKLNAMRVNLFKISHEPAGALPLLPKVLSFYSSKSNMKYGLTLHVFTTRLSGNADKLYLAFTCDNNEWRGPTGYCQLTEVLTVPNPSGVITPSESTGNRL
eukprot:g52538.t1